ncbi:M48 family metallopeptidase [Synechococcus elongatus]|uniref:M48 family metallopeptidase n=1 Tax=Synechococcus elongatus TaxID=32046 RepID=UPI000F7F3498|nr:M48 family metallopeptidase [Synechococcus elongatus]
MSLRRPIIAAIAALALTAGPAQAQFDPRLLNLLRGGIQLFQGLNFSNLNPNQEVQLGRQMNQQMLSQRFRPNRDRILVAYVNDVGQRLAAESDRPDLPWQFQVVDSREINAFATMGGYVYITTGMLGFLSNEAELAGVLAHEIGHIEGRHLPQRLGQSYLQQAGLSALGVDSDRFTQVAVDLALNRPNSRSAEFDADARGLRIMERAGYAPAGLISVMNKLAGLGNNGITFLSTHPDSRERARALTAQLNGDRNRMNQGFGLDDWTYRQQVLARL